jgi:hypothetical protein
MNQEKNQIQLRILNDKISTEDEVSVKNINSF